MSWGRNNAGFDDDAALGPFLIAATAVPVRERGRWLRQLAAQFEPPQASNAAPARRREPAGSATAPPVCDHTDRGRQAGAWCCTSRSISTPTSEALLDAGLLSEAEIDDAAAVDPRGGKGIALLPVRLNGDGDASQTQALVLCMVTVATGEISMGTIAHKIAAVSADAEQAARAGEFIDLLQGDIGPRRGVAYGLAARSRPAASENRGHARLDHRRRLVGTAYDTAGRAFLASLASASAFDAALPFMKSVPLASRVVATTAAVTGSTPSEFNVKPIASSRSAPTTSGRARPQPSSSSARSC